MILAGDIGGTKTVLALYERSADDVRMVNQATFSSREYNTLEQVVSEFMGDKHPSLYGACFGVAGPVQGGMARLTNLPWILDESRLAKALETPRVRLLNDLEAAAYGMLFLAPHEFETLQAGRATSRPGNIAVIAPGTGLGEAILHYDGQHYGALASEGGHTDFAPRTDDEIALLRYLRSAFGGHVSYERILSGAGFANVYRFLRAHSGTPEPAWLTAELTSGDPNAAITAAALAGKDPACVQAMRMFCAVLGAEAANLALKGLTTGGVIIGGGIPPKILAALRDGALVAAFNDKGRFANFTSTLPVRVALNPAAPLIGASHYLTSPNIRR